MDWFCLAVIVVYLLFILIVSCAIVLGTMLIIDLYNTRKERKKKFDKVFPQWSVFRTMLRNQKFPYGKWKYLGKDVSGEHIFERVK